VILVLDGLGIGAMPDVAETRPRDVGANTLAHIVARVDGLQLPALSALGLAAVAPEAGLPSGPPQGAYGRNRLAYPGADTYMGHQELMGTIPGMVRSQLMSEVRDAIRQALEEQEHTVEDFLPLSPMLLVDGLAVVHDNMETDPGQNINVTAPYDKMPVSSILEIGRIVRSAVALSRVIVVMGWGFDLDDIRHHLREGPRGTVGVDSPGLGVYDERYRVRHLGIGVDVGVQIPNIARAAGLEVYLLGKAADVVECEEAVQSPDVSTVTMLHKTLAALQEMESGLIVANVQEGDLSGHEQNAQRWAQILQNVDDFLPSLLEQMGPQDLLMIVGDHGNDPTIGHSQHTREMTPLLVAGPRVHPVPLGTRTSLADVAATAGEFLGVRQPQDGISFLQDVFEA